MLREDLIVLQRYRRGAMPEGCSAYAGWAIGHGREAHRKLRLQRLVFETEPQTAAACSFV